MGKRRYPATPVPGTGPGTGPVPTVPQRGGRRRRNVRRSPQDSVRAAAAWVVEQTLSSLAPVDSFLGTVEQRFDERDLGLLHELVYGTLRWLRRLDQVITSAADRSLDRIEPPLYAPLRVAAYQLLFLDRVPAHAVVNEAVEQAEFLTHRGAAGFVNAVLRRISRDPKPEAWPIRERDLVARLGVQFSHPDFLVERWLERFGEERATALMSANNQPKPLHLLAFRGKGGREVLAESLIDAGLDVEPSALSPLGLLVRRGNPLKTRAFADGELYILAAVSLAAALLLPPRPGERILDAAAVPGGKALALWAHEPRVRLTLADVAASRLPPLRQNLDRLGLEAPVMLADAGAAALVPGSFDRVVLDLPCTGTGTLRKNPELRWRLSRRELERLAALGRRLVAGSAPLVAPGGLLEVITCSLEDEENQGAVAPLMASGAFDAVELQDVVAPPLDAFVCGPGQWQVLPAGDHDGFTVHLLRRREGE